MTSFPPPFPFSSPTFFFYETFLDLVLEDWIFHFVSSIAFFLCVVLVLFFLPSLCLIRLEARSKGPCVCMYLATHLTYLPTQRACVQESF